GGENPFGARDDVTLTVDYPDTKRFITSYHFAAAALGDGDAALSQWTYGDGSVEYAHIPESGYTQTTATHYADVANLQALVNRAEKLDAAVYTADSYKVMTDAVATAKAALTQTDISVTRQAYTNLANAIGGLVKQKETIDRYSLIMVHQMNLTMDLWKNGNGVSSLDNAKSHIAFQQNENGGFTIQKGKFAANDWPDVHYLTPIVLTPVDGKVYLYLDLEANSTWSIFPTFIQGNDTYTGRLNYIIEGSYDETFDAGAGRYYGVYDISDALTALGLDLSKEFIMTFVMNVVPGPVTVNEIAVLTGTPLDIQGTLDRASKIDKTLYTEESYAAFAAAYEKAKAALNTPDAYQATLDLQAKMIGLKKIEEKGTPMGLIIGIIVGAVLALAVIVVIIVVILAAKKKKGGNAPDEAPANE
ncbi:MAG: hypothetical protein IKV35_01710, partial [Clostridia bacterium]|nr:hypothetical protein [Clostridia bacterium]